MRTLKLTLAYDGSAYCGWQVQASGRSIQGMIEQAWLQITGETRRVTASGRTDAGVHALGQVVSLETTSTLPSATLTRALNASLPDDIRVRDTVDMPQGFHAIRDCRGKRYRYRIQAGGIVDVFARRYSWYLRQPLDLPPMCEAARYLVGRRDFRAFQASGSLRKTTVRNVTELSIRRGSSEMGERVEFDIEADGFLYNMVRIIVGTLVEIGQHQHPPSWAGEVLESGRREMGGATAPAHGLFLVSVRY